MFAAPGGDLCPVGPSRRCGGEDCQVSQSSLNYARLTLRCGLGQPLPVVGNARSTLPGPDYALGRSADHWHTLYVRATAGGTDRDRHARRGGVAAWRFVSINLLGAAIWAAWGESSERSHLADPQNKHGGHHAVGSEEMPAALFEPRGKPPQSDQSRSEAKDHSDQARRNDLHQIMGVNCRGVSL